MCLASSVSVKADSHSPHILVVGDSLSAAYGFAPSQGWVSLLAHQLGPRAKLTNASVSGETSAGGRQRLPALLDEHSPDILILELGGNDGLRGYPLARIRETLSQMITHAKQNGAQVLLVGMQIPPNYGRRYSRGFAVLFGELADSHQLPLIPFLLEGVATRPELMQQDGIHPNAKAQPILANTVAAALLPMIQSTTR